MLVQLFCCLRAGIIQLSARTVFEHVFIHGTASYGWLCQTGIQTEQLYIILSGLPGQHKLTMQQLEELNRRQTYLMQFLCKIHMTIGKQRQG